MPKWTKPSEQLPEEAGCGDRILCIVRERQHELAPLRPRLVILQATEDGWYSPDERYAGYSVWDCELWAYERDVVQIAEIL